MPPVVARIGGGAISAEDFKAVLSNLPGADRRPMADNEIKKTLDEMIQEEVLLQEALRLKVDASPDIRQRYRKMLVQKLMDEQVNRAQWNRDVTEDEIKDYYDRHAERFSQPARVRIADIFVSVPNDAKIDEREALREKASVILAEAIAQKGQRSEFGRLVRQYSSPHPVYGKTATGFFDKEGKPFRIDGKLAEAAFNLVAVGDVADQIIETPEGFHVIMLIGKRPAVHRHLGAVSGQIRRFVQHESVESARKAYIDGLMAQTAITVDEQAVSRIQAALAQTPPTAAPE